jgi:hypothetical protein
MSLCQCFGLEALFGQSRLAWSRNNAARALRLARAIGDGVVGNSCRAPLLHNLEPTIDFDSHRKLPR